MTGRENWVQKMLNDQRDKLRNNSISQSNKPIPNPDHDRTGQPVVGTDRTGQPIVGTNPRIEPSGRKTSRSQEIETRSFHEEAVKHDRTGQPVVETRATQICSSDDSKSFNVEDKAAHDRTGQPVVSCHTMCQTVPKHVLLMKAQASTLETKQFMIERCNPF